MPTVIASAQVEDVVKWETEFQTHTDLFKKQGMRSPIHYSANGETNTIMIRFDVDDLDHYLESLQSEETVAAMENDGVIRETVQATILDKSVEF